MHSFDSSYNWIPLSESDSAKILALQHQQLLRIEVENKGICVSLIDGQYHGINDRCPHAGTPFTHGGTCNKRGVVVCPTHHYKFNIKTGRSEDGNHYKIPNYPLQIQEGIAYIGIKKI